MSVAVVLSGCARGTADERATEDATGRITASAEEIVEDAERALQRGDGSDPTTGLGTVHPELYDVPSRDPLTWRFYLHDVGSSGGWGETTIQVGGCLEVVDGANGPETAAIRCPEEAQTITRKYYDVEIDVLTGEPWE